MQKALLIGFILFALAACTQKVGQIAEKPVDLIPQDTMAGLFTDLRLMDAALIHNQKNRKAKISESNLYMYNSILQKYHITSERFERSFDYYASHLDEFDDIYADVISRLSKRKAELEEK